MDYNGIGFSNKNIDKLTKKQKYIAKQSGNPNKFESSDFWNVEETFTEVQ